MLWVPKWIVSLKRLFEYTQHKVYASNKKLDHEEYIEYMDLFLINDEKEIFTL